MLSKEERAEIEARNDKRYKGCSFGPVRTCKDVDLLLAALTDAERERDEAQAKVALAWDEGRASNFDSSLHPLDVENPYRSAALEHRS